ncbi:hypothetical protein EDB80DRAFT_693487 [Ilyonectria destructans]|nr:hypothetical protein EDB80DRAFT_693487 [Ilyonectria destructans]
MLNLIGLREGVLQSTMRTPSFSLHDGYIRHLTILQMNTPPDGDLLRIEYAEEASPGTVTFKNAKDSGVIVHGTIVDQHLKLELVSPTSEIIVTIRMPEGGSLETLEVKTVNFDIAFAPGNYSATTKSIRLISTSGDISGEFPADHKAEAKLHSQASGQFFVQNTDGNIEGRFPLRHDCRLWTTSGLINVELQAMRGFQQSVGALLNTHDASRGSRIEILKPIDDEVDETSDSSKIGLMTTHGSGDITLKLPEEWAAFQSYYMAPVCGRIAVYCGKKRVCLRSDTRSRRDIGGSTTFGGSGIQAINSGKGCQNINTGNGYQINHATGVFIQIRMPYFLPPQGLQQLWDDIPPAVQQPGLQDFRDLELFMEAKGTKPLFKYPDVPSDLLAVMENFDSKLHHILDFSHIYSDRFYTDVAKETCPPHGGAVA